MSEPNPEPSTCTDVELYVKPTIAPRAVGRPPKIDAGRIARIIGGLTAGLSFDVSCAKSGIGPSTGYMWQARGRDEVARMEAEDCDPAPSELLYVEFSEGITRARASAMGVMESVVFNAAAVDGDVKAAQWWLERRNPDLYGARTQTQVTQQSVTVGADGDVRLTELRKLIRSTTTTSIEEAA